MRDRRTSSTDCSGSSPLRRLTWTCTAATERRPRRRYCRAYSRSVDNPAEPRAQPGGAVPASSIRATGTQIRASAGPQPRRCRRRKFRDIEPAEWPPSFTNRSERIVAMRNHRLFALYIVACNPQGGETSMSVGLTIKSIMKQIARDHKVNLPSLDDSLVLHESGFDSLCFAILVARLEDELGID